MDIKQCRICLDSEYSYNNPLISACLCRGSIRWTHLDCLNTWRSVSNKNFYECDLCKFKYNLIQKYLNKLEYTKLYINYLIKMTRDISITIFGYQLLCQIIGYIAIKFRYFQYLIDILQMFVSKKSIYYYLVFGNLIGGFAIGFISIFMVLLILLSKDRNSRVCDIFNELVTKNIRGNSKNKDCCKITIILCGFAGFILCFTYFVYYLMDIHSKKTWRKEQTKTYVIVPNESIPESSILD